MEDFIELLLKTHNLLIKNDSIKQVFNIEDDKKTDNDFYNHEIFDSIDWGKVFDSFVETLLYLRDYAYKNDDVGEDEIELSSNIYDLIAFVEEKTITVFDLNKGSKLLLFKTKILLLMFAVSANVTKNIDKLIDKDLNLLHREKQHTFYRGHSDEKYKLIPSIYRSLSFNENSFSFGIETLYELYRKTNLINKYGKVFRHTTIDEEFCAFMQHSASYSPFLDLTKEYKVALSFATVCKDNLNLYLNKNSAVYKFEFNENAIQSRINVDKIYAYFSKNKLRFFSFFKKDYLMYLAPEDFNPTICVSEKYSNDRMRYQKGAFLFFQSCVVINGYVLIPYKIGKVTKYIINCNNSKTSQLSKDGIYKTIAKEFSEYDYDHLMNPYKFFADGPLDCGEVNKDE